jgi:hypothetical protein
MLALCMSSFTPTSRFGMLMACQMGASLLGELVLLPAMLCLRPARRAQVALAKIPDVDPVATDTHADLPIHPFPAPQPRRRRVGNAK